MPVRDYVTLEVTIDLDEIDIDDLIEYMEGKGYVVLKEKDYQRVKQFHSPTYTPLPDVDDPNQLPLILGQ